MIQNVIPLLDDAISLNERFNEQAIIRNNHALRISDLGSGLSSGLASC